MEQTNFTEDTEDHAMNKETFSIPNISCGHCVNAVKTELEELAGVNSVTGDPESKAVTVAFDAPATLKKIRDTLAEINYPAD